MSNRGPFSRCARLLVAASIMLMAFAIAGPAHAGSAGCTSASGVSVVVDLRQLGGGILERCAPGLGSGATGLDALQTAGVAYQGTSQWGDAFICRLLGRPAADESLRIPGNSNYHEQCISTPPSSAYWAYWSAPDGGPWHYSSAGASSHHITPGGFDGWVFTLNGSQSPPGVAPVRSAAAPAPAATSAQTQQTTPANPDPSGSSSGGSPSQASQDPAGGPATSPASKTPAAAASHASTSPGAGTGPADTGVSSNISAVGGRAASHSSAIPTGAILGACLLAFLVTIGGGTAWRQARARRQS